MAYFVIIGENIICIMFFHSLTPIHSAVIKVRKFNIDRVMSSNPYTYQLLQTSFIVDLYSNIRLGTLFYRTMRTAWP